MEAVSDLDDTQPLNRAELGLSDTRPSGVYRRSAAHSYGCMVREIGAITHDLDRRPRTLGVKYANFRIHRDGYGWMAHAYWFDELGNVQERVGMGTFDGAISDLLERLIDEQAFSNLHAPAPASDPSPHTDLMPCVEKPAPWWTRVKGWWRS